jgi:hypothetical protein
MDASAKLYYGFTISDDEWYELQQKWYGGDCVDEEWEDALAARLGLLAPASDYDTATPEEKEAYSRYWSLKWRLHEFVGVDLDYNGSYDSDNGRILAIQESVVCASWDRPRKIDAKVIETSSLWDERLKTFCDLMGIGIPKGGAGWYLSAFYG